MRYKEKETTIETNIVTHKTEVIKLENSSEWRERFLKGVAKAKAEGKFTGPGLSINPDCIRAARQTMSIAETARYFGISIATVKRLQKTENKNSDRYRKNFVFFDSHIEECERLTILMPVKLYDALEKFAKKEKRSGGEHRTMSAVARMAIAEYLKKYEYNYEHH